VLCIALGIGANTTVYSIVEAVLLRPFPFADPDRIVALHRSRTQEPSFDSFSYPDFVDLQRQTRTLSAIGAYVSASLTFAGKGDEPERVAGQGVSAGMFPLLGVRPVRGRGFLPEEDRPGAAAVILLGNELWQRRFHGDPAIVGSAVLVNGQARTVVGVMPPRFGFPALAQAWVPLAPLCATRPRGDRELDVLARLRPGVSAAQARADLAAFADRLVKLYPEVETGWEARLRPLREELVDAQARLFLVTLLGSVLFVLLIACANVANLQLVRAADRQREVAVRLAFGAGRGRIVRQLLTESLLLAAAGAALGILLAAWGIRLFANMMAAEHPLPYWVRFDLDAPVLLCTLLAAAGTGLPVFQVATMEQVRRAGYWAQGLFSRMFLIFGGLALCLAAIGIYGVLSYSVSQRRREIGVRLALGARQRHVLRLVIGQTMALTAAGIACGIAAALSLNQILAGLLYEVSPTDPASYAGIILFLCGVALLASALPARRALDADPLEALRQE
jgi:putative ABC transport system permease protein